MKTNHMNGYLVIYQKNELQNLQKTQYPANEMQACSIAKDFKDALEPAKEFMYEDLPALELNL